MQNLSNRFQSKFILSIPEFVVFILKRLKNAGFDAYIVGGAVRDECLQRIIADWDVATSALPDEVKTVFRDIRFFSLKHGTVTLVNSGRMFDVSSFKGSRLEEDLARRDYTINAMAYEPEKGEILDPYMGLEDLASKRIRSVGNPNTRLHEDPLRLLRAVRLASELRFRIEKNTQAAIIRCAQLIHSVAPERIREELIKILMSPRPSEGFSLMRKTGLLKHLIPELLEGYLKRQNTHHRYTIFRHIMESVDRVKRLPDLRLAALFHDIAKPRVRKKIGGKWRFFGHEEAGADLTAEIMERLRFSRHMTRRVVNLVKNHMIDYDSRWSDAAVRRLIRRVGTEDIKALILLRRADIPAHGPDIRNLDLLDELEARILGQIEGAMVADRKDLAVNGDVVMDMLKLSSGPEVGMVLKELMEKVTENPELNNIQSLLGILQEIKSA